MKLLLSNIVYLTIGFSCTVLANVEIYELREATGSLENKIESHSKKLEALLKELSSMKSKRESAPTLLPFTSGTIYRRK
jgi:cell division protein FtsL